MKRVTKIDHTADASSKNRKLRVAAYCRVSTDSDAQLESLEAQRSHYEKYILSRDDWEFAGLYYDEGITGTKKEKRPELMRLMADCTARNIDFVITKSISRFSRNTADCLELVRTLQNLGIPIYFEKENINTGAMESELFLAILSSMAEGESSSIAENSKWSVVRRFQNGTFKLSTPPYGYEWNGEEMVVNPEQAQVVKRIFAETLSGKGSEAIAAGLNADGIPAQKGTHWSSTTIRGMLENEKYIGDAIFQKTFTDGQFNRHRNVGQKEQYLATDHHEAIISREDFEAAAALVAQRASEKSAVKGSRKYQNRYCFSGKIICGECGGTFKRRIHTSTGGKYAAWCCTTHIEDKTRCSMRFIRDDDLKVAFTTMLNKLIFGHKFILRPYLKALQSTSGDEGLQRIQHLEQMLEQNTEQRETLTKLMAQGYIDQILFNQENNALLAQADGFRADIQAINSSMTGDTSKVMETEKLLHFAERGSMLAEFDDLFFTKFVDSVRVDSRQQVSFVLKCGLTFKERIGE